MAMSRYNPAARAYSRTPAVTGPAPGGNGGQGDPVNGYPRGSTSPGYTDYRDPSRNGNFYPGTTRQPYLDDPNARKLHSPGSSRGEQSGFRPPTQPAESDYVGHATPYYDAAHTPEAMAAYKQRVDDLMSNYPGYADAVANGDLKTAIRLKTQAHNDYMRSKFSGTQEQWDNRFSDSNPRPRSPGNPSHGPGRPDYAPGGAPPATTQGGYGGGVPTGGRGPTSMMIDPSMYNAGSSFGGGGGGGFGGMGAYGGAGSGGGETGYMYGGGGGNPNRPDFGNLGPTWAGGTGGMFGGGQMGGGSPFDAMSRLSTGFSGGGGMNPFAMMGGGGLGGMGAYGGAGSGGGETGYMYPSARANWAAEQVRRQIEDAAKSGGNPFARPSPPWFNGGGPSMFNSRSSVSMNPFMQGRGDFGSLGGMGGFGYNPGASGLFW